MAKIINGHFGEKFIPIDEAVQELMDGRLETQDALLKINNIISSLIEVIKQQEERISELTDTVYALAPEYEVIETMAESDEEKTELLERYMNHNANYTEELGHSTITADKYPEQKMIAMYERYIESDTELLNLAKSIDDTEMAERAAHSIETWNSLIEKLQKE